MSITDSSRVHEILQRGILLSLAAWGLAGFFHSTWKQAASGASRKAVLCVAGFAVLAGILIYTIVFSKSGLMGWDDAENARRSLVIAQDFSTGRWLQLWNDINAQVLWGPGYALALAWGYTALGATYATGCILSLFFYLLASVAVYRIAVILDRDHGWLIGLIAASLLLSSPAAIQLSATTMSEPFLMFLLPATLLVRLNDASSCQPGRLVAFSLLSAVVFLSKYNYGLLIILSIFLVDLWDYVRLRSDRTVQAYTRSWTQLFAFGYLPFIVVTIAWFSINTKAKLDGFRYFMINVPRVQSSVFSDYRLFYYPRLFSTQYMSASWLPWVILPFLVIGLCAGRRSPARKISVFFLISAAAATAHALKAPRYFVPLLPFLWIIVGYGVSVALRWLAARTPRTVERTALVATASLFLVVAPIEAYGRLVSDAPYVYNGNLSRNPDVIHALTEMTSTIRSEAHGARQMAVWGTFAEFSPALVSWNLLTAEDTAPLAATLLFDPPQESSKDPDGTVAEWLRDHPQATLCAIYMSDGSPLHHRDYQVFNSWKRTYVDDMQNNYRRYGWRLNRESSFPEAGVTMRIYKHDEN
ncbi:MAG: hypothetical protein WA655_00810 [Candidatus Korobacteraceae bacterium]